MTRSPLALLLILLAAAVPPLLSACAPIIVAGAAGAALVGTDRRSAGAQLDDTTIETKLLTTVAGRYGDTVHFNVTSYNGMVLLTGEVPDAGIKDELEKAIAGVANVKGVTNEVTIGASSSFGARSNDTYITSKVKARFIDANKFQANHVKVVTEAGTVFLLGLVTRKEADDAAEIARTTADVKKVVRVFEYVVIREKPQADKPPEEGK